MFINHRQSTDTRTRFSTALTNTKKSLSENRTREDNLSLCTVGNHVYIEYNGPAMRYFVYNTSGEEIGELGVSAFDTLIEKRISKTVGTITALYTHRSGSLKARISVVLNNK